MMTIDLYEAILTRTSVRRYERDRLDPGQLDRVRDIIAGIKPLTSGNQFHVLVKDVLPDEDLAADFGAYGRIVTPPHYLVPYTTAGSHVLEDQGYRVQQVAVRLTAMGIGTCYIGNLAREAEVLRRFELPADSRTGALLIFGTPSTALTGRLFNRAVRAMAGATNKLPVERIFYQDSFDAPAAPPAEIAPLVEAGRNAPSAVNAQPWRFLWRDGVLYAFVKRENPRYRTQVQADYRLYDGGICLANVALALEAQGREGRWQLVPEGAPGSSGEALAWPDHPAELQPLAKLDLAAA